QHDRAHQYYALLFTAASCSFTSLGGSPQSSAKPDRENSHNPLICSVCVPDHCDPANLVRLVSADDRQGVRFCAAVFAVGGLLVERVRNYRVARGATLGNRERAPHFANAGGFIFRNCCVDSVGAGAGIGPRDDSRSVPADICESWIPASFGA